MGAARPIATVLEFIAKREELSPVEKEILRARIDSPPTDEEVRVAIIRLGGTVRAWDRR